MNKFTIIFLTLLLLGINELSANDNSSNGTIESGYCIPPNYYSGPYTGIVNFNLGNLVNTSSESDGYRDFTNSVQAAELNAGTTENVEINLYYDPSMLGYFAGNLNVRIWIDWNQDFDFTDAGEEVLAVVKNCSSSTMSNPYIKLTASIDVPANALSGKTRLRVYEDMVESDGHLKPNPCGYLNSTNQIGQHGECEDYMVEVIGGTQPKPTIEANVSSVNFGNVKIDSMKTMDITIVNKGNAKLNISKVSLIDNFSGVYTIKDNTYPLIIEAGQNKKISVVFKPNKNQDFITKISIESNADNNQKLEIGISGKGVTVGKPVIISDVPKIDFENIDILKTKTLKLKISNTGSAILSITKISFANNSDNAFSHNITNFPISVEVGKDYEFDITFKPIKVSNYSSKIQIESNADNFPVFELQLTGKGADLSGVEELFTENSVMMSLSPNPVISNSILTIKTKNINSVLKYIFIIDIDGNVINSKENKINEIGGMTYQIDCSHLSSGKYYVVCKLNDKLQKIPFLVVK